MAVRWVKKVWIQGEKILKNVSNLEQHIACNIPLKFNFFRCENGQIRATPILICTEIGNVSLAIYIYLCKISLKSNEIYA